MSPKLHGILAKSDKYCALLLYGDSTCMWTTVSSSELERIRAAGEPRIMQVEKLLDDTDLRDS